MKFTGEKAGIAKELHDYFRDKIMNGEYEVIGKDRLVLFISIDSFKFNLWISEGERKFSVYADEHSFMHIEFRGQNKKKAYSCAIKMKG